MSTPEFFAPLAETMKRTVAALREAEVPHMLGGSLAAWARGGPTPEHDLDVMVKPEDARRAQQALVEIGMRPEDPPEGWLLKAWDGEVLVDLIFRPTGFAITDEVLARGDELALLALDVRVMALEDVLASKLMSVTEHNVDLTSHVAMARSLREQIDWDALRERTAGSPFAAGFFTIVEALGFAPVVQRAG
jgi:predicted nucleotidyltransferase